jgi:G3E family GTPase
MKVIILGGFLGSGKTTALLQMAHYLVDNSTSENPTKVMIVENEIGEVGIDDAYLRSGGLEVSNLFAGCACCTLSGELTSTAMNIQYLYDPDWLIIETTGVAYPRSMQDNLEHALKTRASIIVLVDATRWPRLMLAMRHLIAAQVEGSDAVLVNKVDTVDEEALERVRTDIKEIEPAARIFEVSALNGIPEDLWRSIINTE